MALPVLLRSFSRCQHLDMSLMGEINFGGSLSFSILQSLKLRSFYTSPSEDLIHSFVFPQVNALLSTPVLDQLIVSPEVLRFLPSHIFLPLFSTSLSSLHCFDHISKSDLLIVARGFSHLKVLGFQIPSEGSHTFTSSNQLHFSSQLLQSGVYGLPEPLGGRFRGVESLYGTFPDDGPPRTLRRTQTHWRCLTIMHPCSGCSLVTLNLSTSVNVLAFWRIRPLPQTDFTRVDDTTAT